MKKKKITSAKRGPQPKSKAKTEIPKKKKASDLVYQADAMISKAKKRFDELDPQTKKQLAATAAALVLVAAMTAGRKKKLTKK